jgi:hypothetical protein
MNNLSKKTAILYIVFILFTIFLIFQRQSGISWDFAAYTLNGKYLFHGGGYYETMRPPLAPLIIGIFLFLGYIGEYIFIIFVSCLFLYSIIKTSDTLKEKFNIPFDKEETRLIFYMLSLSPFSIFYATKEGTEMLTLSLFMLFFVAIVNKKNSGLPLSLGFLSRYASLIYFPFLFINKNFKKIIFNLATFIIIISPWFIWNYLTFGNFFTGFVDGYVNNYYSRLEIIEPFKINQIIYIFNIILIPAAFGLIFKIKDILHNKSKEETIPFFVITAFLFITLYQFYNIPFKIDRYLYNLIFPLSSLSLISLSRLKNKMYKDILIILLLIYFLFSLLILSYSFQYNSDWKNRQESASTDIKNLGLENCTVLTPHWTPAYYYSENAYPLINQKLNESIERGYIILIFSENTFDDKFNQEEIKHLPLIIKREDYVILGESNSSSCIKKSKFDETYVEDHCKVISEVMKIYPEKTYFWCEKINSI